MRGSHRSDGAEHVRDAAGRASVAVRRVQAAREHVVREPGPRHARADRGSVDALIEREATARRFWLVAQGTPRAEAALKQYDDARRERAIAELLARKEGDHE